MGKVIEFKKNFETVMDLVDKRLDEDDCIGALSALLSEEKRCRNKLEIYAEIAELYSEMELYDSSVEYWYKFVNIAGKKTVAEGYNGLGANYYFLGNKNVAGYYFNLQLMGGNPEEFYYEDVLLDYLDEIVEDKRNSYYVAYPVPDDDFAGILEQGKEYIKSKQFESAIGVLSGIPTTSKNYPNACVELGVAYYYSDNSEKAIAFAKYAVENGAEDAFALCNLISMLFGDGRIDEIIPYLKMLEDKNYDDPKDIYKVLTVYCELGRHEKAKEAVDKILSLSEFDVNSLFLKGLIEYNLGNFAASMKSFQTAYIIEGSHVALYYYRYLEKVLSTGEKVFKELDYVFDIPSVIAQARIKQVKRMLSESYKELKKRDKEQLFDYADWAFAVGNRGLQAAMADILARLKTKESFEFLTKKLISASVYDDVKCTIVTLLAENGYDKMAGVVYGNIYKKLQFLKIDLGEEPNGIFTRAYATAFGRLSVVETEKLYKLRDGLYEIYYALEGNGNMKKITDVNALTGAIYVYSGLNIVKGLQYVGKLFDTTAEAVSETLEIIRRC